METKHDAPVKSDVKSDAKSKPASLVDTKQSAPEMLDPRAPLHEAESTAVRSAIPQGSSYVSPEALAKAEEEAKKSELKKSAKPVSKAGQSRSAIDHDHSSIVMPGALKDQAILDSQPHK